MRDFMKYNRVLLKLSGEALSGNEGVFDITKVKAVSDQIKILNEKGIDVAIVVGGGNL
jgi:uridylate kinase